MSEQVTVKTVGEGRPWEHGITYWDVCFERNGQDFHCTWGKKDDPPLVGEQAEGEFFQKNGEWRFRKASKPQGGGGSFESSSGSSSAPTGGKRDWKPESQYDPEKVARMSRAHAQEMALRWAALQPDRTDMTLPKIFQFTDAFERDVQTAGQAANSAQGSPPASEAGAPPSQSASPGSNSQSADEPEFFSKLLQDAHMDAAAANELGKFMSARFSIEQKQKAQRELGEPQAQGGCIGRLRAAYEQSTSKVLPLSTDDASIPF